MADVSDGVVSKIYLQYVHQETFHTSITTKNKTKHLQEILIKMQKFLE